MKMVAKEIYKGWEREREAGAGEGVAKKREWVKRREGELENDWREMGMGCWMRKRW